MKKFAVFIYVLWVILIGIIYVILCWVFVAIIAVLEILVGKYNLVLTKLWTDEIETPKEFIDDTINCLKRLREEMKP